MLKLTTDKQTDRQDKNNMPPIIRSGGIKRTRSNSILWWNPFYQQKINQPIDNTKTSPKPLITQRFRTDLGVTTVIQLVWLNHFTGTEPSHSQQKPYMYNQKDNIYFF